MLHGASELHSLVLERLDGARAWRTRAGAFMEQVAGSTLPVSTFSLAAPAWNLTVAQELNPVPANATK